MPDLWVDIKPHFNGVIFVVRKRMCQFKEGFVNTNQIIDVKSVQICILVLGWSYFTT